MDTLMERGGAFLVMTAPMLLVVVVVGVAGAAAISTFRWVARGAGQVGIIEGYVGTIGAGKTMLAVQHALALARARNAVLLSNIPIRCGVGCLDGTHDIEHELLPITDDGVDLGELTRRAFRLRRESRGLVLLMDEVGVVMPARLWRTFSVALMWVLQQSRKLTCEWIWTAQDASFVDQQLRSLTAAVHFVRSIPPPSMRRRAQGKRPWGMVVSTYLPSDAPRAHGTSGGRGQDRRMGRKFVRYRREWEGSFDTDGVVLPSRHLPGSEVLAAAVAEAGIDVGVVVQLDAVASEMEEEAS